MEKVNFKYIRKKRTLKLVLLLLLILFIICMTLYVLAMSIRNNIISKQASENINLEEKTTTVFCSGKNFTLNEDVYNQIKEEGLDLIIYNLNFIARIDTEKVNNNININVDINNGNYDKSYDVSLNTLDLKELSINVSEISKNYVSEFSNGEFISNEVKVLENGYAKLKLNDSNSYTIAYITPEDFEIKDMTINKEEEKKADLGINDEEYTYGSVLIGCSDEDAVEIDYMNVKGKKLGEYFIFAKTDNVYNEAKLTIIQSIEKIEVSQNSVEIIKGNQLKINATVYPEDAQNKELDWKSSDENVATVDSEGNINAVGQGECQIEVSSKEAPSVSQIINVKVKNSNVEQINGITYVNGILLVNKNYSVPSDYAPGLIPEAYSAFLSLKEDAKKSGFDIELISGYRSYETQRGLYNNYVATYGQAEADTFSARPGTSEHQTGLAMDVGWIDDSYGDTPSGIWLAQNCYKYGFIIRYPKGKENITGYKYEPWHIRYLGIDIAKDVYESGLCLEEYLGVN